MKKEKIFLIIVLLFVFIFLSVQYINDTKGTGTFADPYYTRHYQTIYNLEEKFNDIYLEKFFEGDVCINEYTDYKWINNSNYYNNYYIESIRVLGSENVLDLLFYYIDEGFEEELNLELKTRIKNNKILFSTSYFDLDQNFDIYDTGKLRNWTLSDDSFKTLMWDYVRNNSSIVIVNYKMKYQNEWYHMCALIHDKSLNHIIRYKE